MADTQEQLLTEISTLGATDFIRTVSNPISAPDSTVIQKSNLIKSLTADFVSLSISTDTNDLTTTGLSTSQTLRLSSTASVNVTGIQTGSAGRVLYLHNVGTFNITLVDESTLSTSANRFALTSNFTLFPDGMVVLQYDSSTGRWRVAGGAAGREILMADRTYYVRKDGSDSNSGLINSAGGAFLTIQKAVDVVSTLDINAKNVVIQVGAGTYVEGVNLKNVVGFSAVGNLTLRGDTTTPANCYINGSGTVAIGASPVAVWNVEGFKLGGGVHGVVASNGAIVRLGYVEYTAVSNYQNLATQGAVIVFYGPVKLSGAGGGAVNFLAAIDHGVIFAAGITFTLLASLAYSNIVAAGRFSLIALHSSTWTLGGFTVTGYRYSVDGNSVVFVNGAGATFIPGSIAGITSTGGQYY